MNRFHEQAEMFRDALALTQQQTGFAERLIEKDYFCTVLLEYLASDDGELIQLVRRKLAVADNAPVDVSEGRLRELRQQAEPQLRPVLRPRDYAEFDLPRAFRLVADMAAKVR